MDRRRFLLTTLAGALTAPLAASAQPAGKAVRIGIMSAGQTRSSPLYRAFEQRLRELGYVDGQNATIEFRGAEGKPELVPELTRQLVSLNLDVLLTAGGEVPVRAAKEATTSTPIIMVCVDFDPIARGYVASLARPGGNMTGIIFQQLELTMKRLELLKQALPEATRVAVLWDASAGDQLKAAEDAAGPLHLRLQAIELRHLPYDFEGAFRTAGAGRAQALLVLTTPVIFRERLKIASIALRHRLPSVFAFREHVEAGGLLAYGPNFSSMFRRAADYVDKVLKGARPGDLPIEQPDQFQLVINLKTAKALGLTIPPSLLARADEVIH